MDTYKYVLTALTLAVCVFSGSYPLHVAAEEEVASSSEASPSTVAEDTPTSTDADVEDGEGNVATPGTEPAEDTASTTSNADDSLKELPVDADTATSSAELDGEIVVSDGIATSTATTSNATTQEMRDASTTVSEASSPHAVHASSTSTSSDSEASVTTGLAVALANILNIVNTSFINSNGMVLFSNFFDMVSHTIDLRNGFVGFGDCNVSECNAEHVQVNIANDATIDNNIFVTANSGGNTIDGSDHALIDTGNAYAGVNLVNVANTTVVDSNYLLVTMNAFGGVDGDIVFPSLSSILTGGYGYSGDIDASSTATVNNHATTTASSGGNTSDAGSSTISTGNAKGTANIFNQLNSTLAGGQSVMMVFRVQGDWVGEVFGAPDGLSWTTGSDGSIYLFDTGGQTLGGGSSSSLAATNAATINNNVNVVALTGDNAITGAKTAAISTGDAFAGANILNVANANVIGRNWVLAVINIFGDFKGNIAFGRPDLWVGAQAEAPATIREGTDVTYTLTVLNNGDSEATNVRVESSFDREQLEIQHSSRAYTESADGLVWDVGRIPAGGAVEVSYTATVEDTKPGTDIESAIAVSERETDDDTTDNTDVITIRTTGAKGNGIRIELGKSNASGKTKNLTDVDLDVSRTPSESVIDPVHESSTQTLTIKNNHDTRAQDVIVHDILRDPSGNILQDEVWELGDVLPNEEIEITYTTMFDSRAPAGLYTFTTTVEGTNVDLTTHTNGTLTLLYADALAPELAVRGASTTSVSASSVVRDEENSGSTTLEWFLKPTVAEAATVGDTSGTLSSMRQQDILNMILIVFFLTGASLGVDRGWRLLHKKISL